MNSNLMLVSSQNKTLKNASTTNFTVNFGNNSSANTTTKLVVKSVDVPNIFYNIRSTGGKPNNVFRFQKTGVGVYDITIPEGQYTITELITAIEALTTSFGMSIVYDEKTLKLSFTTTTTISYINEDEGNSMARVLGILISTPPVSDTLSYDSTGIIDLGGIDSVYLVSQSLSDGTNMTVDEGRANAILAVIPLTVPFKQVEHWRCQHPELDCVEFPSQKAGSSLRTIDIKVVDKYGFELDLKGHDIVIIIKIYHNSP
jgi:hypothetical protein